jgi:hypothetical protein
MSKKPKSKLGHIVLLIVIVVVVLVVLKQRAPVEEPEGAEEVEEAPEAEEQVEEAPEAEEAQPLYPDLCYAEGGVPRNECKDGETSIGDVPGFKTPHICCVSE